MDGKVQVCTQRKRRRGWSFMPHSKGSSAARCCPNGPEALGSDETARPAPRGPELDCSGRLR
eukprot:9195574-Lingulodinium_polyedra.AAC.1